MFKLYRKLKLRDWICVVFIIGLTVLQVMFSMNVIDFMQDIIKSITYLNYHNNPSELATVSQPLVDFVTANGWEAFKDAEVIINQFHLPSDAAIMLSNVANATPGDIWYNGGMMVLNSGFCVLCQIVISVIASLVAADLSTNIRSELYEKVEYFSLAEINKFSTPSLITRTTNDIQQVQMTNLIVMRMVFAAPITAIWAIAKIRATSLELTWVSAISIVLLLTTIIIMMIVVLPKFKIVQKLIDKLNAVTRENLTGIRIVRAYNAEEYQQDKFNVANENITKAQLFTGRVMGLMSPLMMLLMNGTSLAIYWVGATLINKGQIDYATVTAFMMLSTQIIMSFVMLMLMFVLWPRASISAGRINEVLSTASNIQDPENELERTEIGSVEFRNVSFSYDDASSNVLEDITFKVNKGETLAFIGSTGSGKSTLVNLIPRLYEATSGEILIDGVNVKNLKQHTLRSIIGYVPQKGLLFRGSVKSNIAFGNPNLSEEEIKKASDMSCATEFIENMEQGYDSMIAQGGKNVSGGQKQRLCIARAVAINPEILIFDDSFSALDYKTDKQVRENLKENLKDATKLIVAQRIGTIMDADEIIVLDEGKIVGKGKHEELLRNCNVYKEIALSQLSKEELGLCQE